MKTSRTHSRNKFYKYMSADTAKKVLKTKTLRWSSPFLFNDPFDVPRELFHDIETEQIGNPIFQIIKKSVEEPDSDISNFRKDCQSLISHFRKVKIPEKFWELSQNEFDPDLMLELSKGFDDRRKIWSESTIPNLRILCLSEEKDIVPMWYHYADKHQGVVIEIILSAEPSHSEPFIRPVRYCEYPPELFTSEGWVQTLMSLEDPQIPEKTDDEYIYTKQSHWSYEKEWRIAKLDNSSQNKLYSDFPLQSQCLSKIYFGPEIKYRDRKFLLNLISKEWPCVNTYDMSFEFRWEMKCTKAK